MIIFVLFCMIAGLGTALWFARRAEDSSEPAKGKGKKGVFGSQIALALQ